MLRGGDASGQPRAPPGRQHRLYPRLGPAPPPRALYHPRDSTNNLQPPPEKHRLMHLGIAAGASAHPPAGPRDRRQDQPRGPSASSASKRLSQRGGWKRRPGALGNLRGPGERLRPEETHPWPGLWVIIHGLA